jgi:hypothetical protein
MDGADQALGVTVIADRLPRRFDPAAEGRFRDDPAGPDILEEFVLRNHAIPVLDQVTKELEHLGLDVARRAAAAQLEGRRVQLTVTETVNHWGKTISLRLKRRPFITAGAESSK